MDMADLQSQLQAILGDAETMSQITAIAQALTGGQAQDPPPFTAGQESLSAPQGDYIPAGQEGTFSQLPPPDPSPPPDLSSLLGGLGMGGIDPRLLQIALRVYGEYSAQDDERATLLASLKPFLKAERLEKMEKAEKIARLSRVVRVAIQLLREEGEGHV